MPLPECTRIEFDNDYAQSHLIEQGWREVEILETWKGPRPKGIGIMGYTPTLKDIPALQAVAVASFKEDRLHKDPLVLKEDADNSKRKWVQDAVTDYKRAVFVYGSPPHAFLSVFPGKTMIIDLLAVHPGHRGENAAKGLIITAAHYCEAEFIQAGTQSTNDAARALYQSLGMEVVRRQRTFHK